MSPVFCGTNVVSICKGGNMAGFPAAPLLEPEEAPPVVCDVVLEWGWAYA